MYLEEGQNLFHCEYCGGYDFPEPNQDGVALLDELSSFPCPMCGHSLVSAAIKDVRILSCPNCRGNLIDQSKMLPILSHAKSLDATNEAFLSASNKAELTQTALCPSCRKMMNTYPYGGPGNIIIQGCDECRLIWLDFGELSKIIHAYLQMYKDPPDELGAKKKWITF
jgi:Zn-finger nucleic acid-binding protein